MSDKFRVAIVGLGRISVQYDLDSPHGDSIYTHARAISRHPDCMLVGGVDVSAEARARFIQHYKASGFERYEDLVRVSGAPDLVVLATPALVRLSAIKEIIAQPPGLLLIEKPLANTLDEADQLLEICQNAGIKVAVNYIRRFDPVLSRIPALAVKAGLGNPVACSILYSGDILESGSHYIDLLVSWFGSGRVRQTWGKGSGQIDFGDVKGVLQSVRTSFGIGEIDLLFADGRMAITDYGEKLTIWKNGPDPNFPGYQRLGQMVNAPQPEMRFYQKNVLDRLLAEWKIGVHTVSTGADARESLRLSLELTGS